MTQPVRLVVAGTGLVGKRHVAAIKHVHDAELLAIVEPGPDGADYADGLGVLHYQSLSDMFEAQTPDGVILSTPTHLHIEQALACITERCAVLVEKPVTVTASDAALLARAAKAADIPVLVGHHRRHNPLVQEAHRLLQEGAIGDIRAAQVTCWFRKPDSYFDIAPWRKQKGAGPISVNLVHDIDLMRHFCGEVVRVQAQASPSARGFENEDLAVAILTFANGALGTVTVSDSIVAPWSWELTSGEYPIYPKTAQSCYLLGGSEGSLSLPDMTVWRHQDEQSWWNPICASTTPHPSCDPLANQIKNFADVICGQDEPLVSAVEGWRTLQVVEAIQIAATTQQSVTLDPISLDTDTPALPT